MVTVDWLQNKKKELEEEKKNALIEKGYKLYWRPEEGESVVKIFIDAAPEEELDGYGKKFSLWKLVEPFGYYWRTTQSTNNKIITALIPFLDIPLESRPPFVALKVIHDKNAIPKFRYTIKLYK